MNKTKQIRVILSGGGTGGHIYPAISIANEIKKRFDAEILFVGASDRMEMQKVPQSGYNIKGLWISGIQRKLSLKNLIFPFKLVFSIIKSFFILKRFKPDFVVGTGGFASGPLLYVASRLGLPTVIQEQNSYPGITNKFLSRTANIICVAYSGLERFFGERNIKLTGNPVRQDLISDFDKTSEKLNSMDLDASKKTLLVLGGSLGSKRINELIASKVNYFESLGIQVIWQCGKLYYNTYKAFGNKNIKVFEFLNDMNSVFSVSDFIISRAGASSVSELCLVGKPVLFIPSPNVSENHQYKNAKAVESNGGALLIEEKELDDTFENVFTELFNSEETQTELSKNIKQLAKPNATKDIVDLIEELV